MALVQIECAYCGSLVFKEAGGVNRSRRIGAPVFCGKVCSGLARRSDKTIEQRRAEKKEYDARRSVVMGDEIKAKKREYHKRTYDPVKAAAKRKKRMPLHIKYCRRPEYRAWKRGYGVRVKPLEWVERVGVTGTFDANTSIGHYIASITDDGRGHWFIVGLTTSNYTTANIEAVKAAAQADYEQRILSALSAWKEGLLNAASSEARG